MSILTGVDSTRMGKRPLPGSGRAVPTDGQRLVKGMAAPEHPLVSQGVSNTEPDLIGQGLEGQAAVGFRESAGYALVGSMFFLDAIEEINGLFKPAFQHDDHKLQKG